jgi:hypothetical protein
MKAEGISSKSANIPIKINLKVADSLSQPKVVCLGDCSSIMII